ncbi:hypothetical protein GOD95_11325 [Paeniclostridium sordellii]|uniref:hypothetical protein n=1 Tax=Paraclostridium sordellii TaxID=1505 RepID=UPI0012EE10E2|nr:hypothetical protein [Paeniclostridium sordellii]MDU6247477.1 hypothetical protein [Paeniclostridium sordellii]MVO72035.1 hypothetical protein [Paeniclostridium sordellii]
MKQIYDNIQDILEYEGIVFDSDFEGASSALSTKSVAFKTEDEMIRRLDNSVSLLFKKTKDIEGYHYYIIYGNRLKKLYDGDYIAIGSTLADYKYRNYIDK